MKSHVPAFEIKFGCVAQTLRRAARLLSRRYEETLRFVNLTVSQYTILQALTHAEKLPFGAISSVLGLEQTTLSRLLKTLEKRELIAIRTDNNDRRSRIVSITAAGSRLFNEAAILWQKINDESLSRLSEDDWKSVEQALLTLSK
jgi:DNA-binding MarR family transcriptional regulator